MIVLVEQGCLKKLQKKLVFQSIFSGEAERGFNEMTGRGEVLAARESQDRTNELA
jgi:hypothetical protein